MDTIKQIDIDDAMLEITMESDFQYNISINDNIKIETNDTIFEGTLIAIDDFDIQIKTENNIIETIAFDKIRTISYV